ncbi:MAG: hypothetical protein GF331_11005 [Chitinivibrionales bacterium]|nr:hypothetical protein [Chitinivibrionales bacterium]
MYALIQTGRHEQLVATYGSNLRAVGMSLLSRGEHAAFLKQCPDLRNKGAQVLIAQGRYDEVLLDYPDQRRECGRALVAKGDIKGALERFPESMRDCAAWLLEQQRWKEVAMRFSSLPYESGMALTELGRYKEVAIGRGKVWVSPDQACDLLYRRALCEWIQGRRSSMDSLAANPPPWFQYLWNHQRFNRFLLGPVLYGLAGDTAHLQRGCRAVLEQPVQTFGRRLWFEAAYLSGRIDEKQFLDQPYAMRAQWRLKLLEAIRNDMQGNTAAALQGYRAWQSELSAQVPFLQLHPQATDSRDIFTDLGSSWTVRRFVQWRVARLADKKGGDA